MTLEVAAFTALITVLPFIHLNGLLRIFAQNAEFLCQHGYSLRQGATPESNTSQFKSKTLS